MDQAESRQEEENSGSGIPPRESGRQRLFAVIPERDYVAYMENVVESLHLPIFAIDRNGIVTVWNRAMERIFSVKDGALGSPI
ncbi:MAG: PAS domain-containing protein, partial [Planctomycetota bacterium]